MYDTICSFEDVPIYPCCGKLFIVFENEFRAFLHQTTLFQHPYIRIQNYVWILIFTWVRILRAENFVRNLLLWLSSPRSKIKFKILNQPERNIVLTRNCVLTTGIKPIQQCFETNKAIMARVTKNITRIKQNITNTSKTIYSDIFKCSVYNKIQ